VMVPAGWGPQATGGGFDGSGGRLGGHLPFSRSLVGEEW
jgi:hypothetical protein